MNNKTFAVGLIVVALLAVGAYFFPQVKNLAGAVSSSGAFTNTPGFYSIVLAPTTANGTSTSILNSGASDRAIMGSYVMCTSVGSSQTFGTGAGLTSTGWTLTAATTTVSGSGLVGNTNYILNSAVATTSGLIYIASTTEGVLPYNSRIWPAGTYLTFNFNATNTASCALGVEALPL